MHRTKHIQHDEVPKNKHQERREKVLAVEQRLVDLIDPEGIQKRKHEKYLKLYGADYSPYGDISGMIAKGLTIDERIADAITFPGNLHISGGSSSGPGANIQLYGGSHRTQAQQIKVRGGGLPSNIRKDLYAQRHLYGETLSEDLIASTKRPKGPKARA